METFREFTERDGGEAEQFFTDALIVSNGVAAKAALLIEINQDDFAIEFEKHTGASVDDWWEARHSPNT